MKINGLRLTAKRNDDGSTSIVLGGSIEVNRLRVRRSHFGGYRVFVSDRYAARGDGFACEYLSIEEAIQHSYEGVLGRNCELKVVQTVIKSGETDERAGGL